MKKMKKLLSVLLAVILSLSCMSVMASAAKAEYQDIAELEALGAYSPYGAVTRLSTEERSSMLLDFLDVVLPPLNINMGYVVDISFLGLQILIDFTSVDQLLKSLDSFKTTMEGGLWTIAAGILNFGILEELNFEVWTKGMTRGGTDQYTILKNLMTFLAGQTGLVDKVLSNGLELGLLGSFIKGLDLSSINNLLKDIPGLIKGLIFPLFERWDHTLEEVNYFDNAIAGDGKVREVLEYAVNAYFKSPMSLTTVKADANGNITSGHDLPGGDTNRRKFVISQDKKTITVYQYHTQVDVDKNAKDDIVKVGYMELDKYVLVPENVDKEGKPTEKTDYVYACVLLDTDGNPKVDKETGKQVYGEALKYYKPGSYWLPKFATELKNGTKTFSITSESGAALLYKMIPYVFDAMAPTVVNGSLKKLLAQFFGTQFIFVGNVENGSFVPSDELTATEAIDKFGLTFTDSFFTEAQGEYLWEWSNYKVIGDKHFYRFEDQVFYGDTTKSNDYFNIINWDFKIEGDFLDEFVPSVADLTAVANGTAKSTAGYTRILHGVNDFLCKLADTVLDKGNKDLAGEKTFTYTITEGDNSKLVDNIKAIAQAILGFHPEHIFGATYDKDGKITSYGSYYSLIMKEDNDDLVLTGIAALVIDALAPQMHLPDAASLEAQNVKLGGLLAAMLRELATQLVPSINYDKLIYSNYNTMTFVSGKDNSYWLDVLLTIGTDIGFKYLTALADLNEDKFSKNFAKGGSIDWQLSREYTEADLKLTSDVNLWEQRVDYIIDWALYVGGEAGEFSSWNMAHFVQEYLPAGYDMETAVATIENPWAKLDAIFDSILFFDQFTSETDLETALRGTILDLVNLNWENILGTETEKGLLDIPASSKLRTTNLLDALSLEIKDLVNGLFKNVGGGSYYLIPSGVNNLDELVNTTNLTALVKGLIGVLGTAATNGLLEVVLPIVGFFLGWTTDAQKYADPTVYNTAEYLYASGAGDVTSTFNIVNNSSGMLLKHRADTTTNNNFVTDADKQDQHYQLKITGITSSYAGTKFDKTTATILPYGSASIKATIPWDGTETVVRFDLTYTYVGKDGEEIGGTMHKVVYQLITSRAPDSAKVAEVKGNGILVSEYEKYVFTDNIYNAVMNQAGVIGYSKPTLSSPVRVRIGHAQTESGGEPKGIAATFFGHMTTTSGASEPGPLIDNGWEIYFGGEGGDGQTYPGSTDGFLYVAKDGVTSEGLKNSDGTITEFPLGIYDMGSLGIKGIPQTYDSCKKTYSDKDGKTGVFSHIFYYYEDYGIDAAVSEYTSKELIASDFAADAQDEFATYEEKLMYAVKLAQYPIYTSYNDEIRPLIYAEDADGNVTTDVIADLKAAYDALINADANASAVASNTEKIEAALALDTTVNGKEINYQDFALYEYFEYQDYRTANRNLLKGMVAPEVLVGGYIKGSGISYTELQKVIAAEESANANKAKAITSSITEYTEEEIAASQKAHDDFKAPTYTELYLDDQATRINWYRQFILPVAADLDFITKEIGYANANYPINDETKALYTEGSWERYTEAYADATAITASSLPSDVFAAKYELMVSMKNLLLKADSAIEAGATAKLIDLAAKAEDIFEMNFDEIELSEVAIEKGLTKDEALGHLLFGLGYYYEGEDGNTWNLYDNSAYEYIDNDRPNKSTNIDRINACVANLEACLAYFETAAPELVLSEKGAEMNALVTKSEIFDGYDGFVCGIDTYIGEIVEDYLGTAVGSVEVLPSPAGSTEGTGAIINLLDANGEVVESYVFVLFGDVTGDGFVDSTDSGIIAEAEVGLAEFDSYYCEVAGDFDANGYYDSTDAGAVGEFEVGLYDTTQADIAVEAVVYYGV